MDSSDNALRVLVADRQEFFRRGVISVLRSARRVWSCEPAADMAELLDQLAQQTADVLLMELGMPGMNGTSGILQLRARHPNCAVVVLGESEDRDTVLACLAAGAQGYVAKDASPTQLLCAVETVLAGAVAVPATLVGRAPAPVPPSLPAAEPALANFTGRQSQVFRLLVEGCATKTIARRLDLAVGTVKVHLAAIYRQLGVHGRLEALARVHSLAVDELAFGDVPN